MSNVFVLFAASLHLPEDHVAAGAHVGCLGILPSLCSCHHLCALGFLYHQSKCMKNSSPLQTHKMTCVPRKDLWRPIGLDKQHFSA